MKNKLLLILFVAAAFSACRCTPSSLNLAAGNVTTLDAGRVTSNSATLNGQISGFNIAPREVGFEWGYAEWW